ncbi:MAG: AraC family transcriptional regulator [Maribacter litoralis]|uniref:AraC family transcriptional regulator n=1 Tax=Maribacter litoralis TaxID=2059726 RepID=UPI0032996C27
MKIESLTDKHLLEKITKRNTFFEKKPLLTTEEKIQVCLDLFSNNIFKSSELAKKFNDEAYQLSENINYKEGMLKAISNEAYILFIKGKFDESQRLLLQLNSQNDISKYREILADSESLKSYIFTERGEYDTALENSHKLLEIGENSKNSYILMKAYSAISHVYLRLGEYEKALENCLLGLDYIIKLEKHKYILAKIDEIARMTQKLKGSSEASKIYDFYLRIEKKTNNAGDYIQSAVYMNIANIYLEENKFKEAQDFLSRALEIISKNEYKFRKPRVYNLKAELNMKMSDTLAAIDNYKKAFYAAKEISALDVVKNTSNSLSTLLIHKGDDYQASCFTNLYNQINDSLFSIELEQSIQIIEAKRKINVVTKEKRNLEIDAQRRKASYQNNMLVLSLLFIIGIVGSYYYYQIKNNNKLLIFNGLNKISNKLLFNKSNDLKSSNVLLEKKAFVSPNENCCYIGEDIRDIIMVRLKRLEDDLFFLNPNCRLQTLAEELQTNQKYLSQVINHEKKSNFNNYINLLRINHLSNRLKVDKDFRTSKLSYIAFSSGFNNVNTFQSAFKKNMGVSPSQFISQLSEKEIMS